MNKKTFFILLIYLLLSNCGFEKIHKSAKNVNFQIEQISYSGDKTTNDYLNILLSKYKKINQTKKYKIMTNTIYEKNIFSKNKAGNPSEYQIKISTVFKVYRKDKFIKSFNYNQKLKVKNKDDKLQEKDNERIIKQNYASTILNKFIVDLMFLK